MRIGILYPGGLGTALGKAIAQAGGTAITCLDGRSKDTRDRAAVAGFVVVPSLEDVLRQSELIISLVPADAAAGVANSIAHCRNDNPPANNATANPIYIEANSISPHSKRCIAQTLSHAGISCIDGAFFGPTNSVCPDNVFVLSGPGVERILPFFQEVVEVRSVGQEIGQAAALKMTLAIVTKAFPALFLEMVCASAGHGQLTSALALMRRLHPGLMNFLERTIPTYPTYVARRVQELKEVTDWLHELGESDAMTRTAAGILERLRLARIEPHPDWSFDELVYHIAQTHLLRAA
jgi:3-hydroxyisobutyrate dehydrogenase-like beta-hydroxyacid dehydrogenase